MSATKPCQGRVQLAPTNFVPCSNRGTGEYEGHVYCNMHNPTLRVKRLMEKDRKRRVERAAPELLKALVRSAGTIHVQHDCLWEDCTDWICVENRES